MEIFDLQENKGCINSSRKNSSSKPEELNINQVIAKYAKRMSLTIDKENFEKSLNKDSLSIKPYDSIKLIQSRKNEQNYINLPLIPKTERGTINKSTKRLRPTITSVRSQSTGRMSMNLSQKRNINQDYIQKLNELSLNLRNEQKEHKKFSRKWLMLLQKTSKTLDLLDNLNELPLKPKIEKLSIEKSIDNNIPSYYTASLPGINYYKKYILGPHREQVRRSMSKRISDIKL